MTMPTLKRKVLQAYMTKIINIFGDICFLQFLSKWCSTFQGLQIGYKALFLQIGHITFDGFAASCLVIYEIRTFVHNTCDIWKNQRAYWVKYYNNIEHCQMYALYANKLAKIVIIKCDIRRMNFCFLLSFFSSLTFV